MCGIAGLWRPTAGGAEELALGAERMAQALRHRGPDDKGVWVDTASGLALGHRRLAILDLSGAGHQPMVSASGRYVIAFNGEIYNHLALRAELETAGCAPAWRGHSDTEVLLEAIAAWGTEETLRRSRGMFAFALWDREARTLTLARDRFGEKPLYYGYARDALVFGSELKALRALDPGAFTVDREALALYARYAYVPAPHSIYRGIRKLPAGTLARVEGEALCARRLPDPVAWWSLDAVIDAGRADPWRGSEAEAVDELERRLGAAVREQMLADVPVGAFLSGGIDSSTIVALMQSASSEPVRTFTIGFEQPQYDEAAHARAIARHLHTRHTEFRVTEREAMAVIASLPALYDEPFADSSQIPTYLVARLARREVKVSLSGDGGDEVFGGYNRHFWVSRVRSLARRWPIFLKAGVSGALRAMPPSAWDVVFRLVGPALPAAFRQRLAGEKVHKFATILNLANEKETYEKLAACWDDEAVLGGGPRSRPSARWRPDLPLEAQMMRLDTLHYLPDDILVKVDRAAMGVSLETRMPMLDPSVVEFAWKLPLSFRVRGHQGKWVLRRVLERHVPAALFERPKMGFGVPLEDWLRGELREWAEALLDRSRLVGDGWFDVEQVRAAWDDHLSGRRNFQHRLWTVLMFQAWLDAQRETGAS